ncbi:nicotianamine synthase family protein [Desulfolithobacter sp.]
MTPDVKKIHKEFFEIHEAIRNLSDKDFFMEDARAMKRPFQRLDKLAAMEVEDRVLQEIYHSSELEPLLPAISRLRNSYGLYLEIEQARSVLAASVPWDRLREFTFYPNYEHLADMEMQGAGLKPGDTAVFLGSGPLPLSLIFLCSRYDLKGIGIEQDASFVKLSRQVVDHLGLAGRISIRKGDHFSLPLEEHCHLFMIAAMARPKREIFHHLACNLPPGSLVSYRLYEKGLRRLLDQDGNFSLPPGFTEYRRIRPRPPVNNTVVVVKINS